MLTVHGNFPYKSCLVFLLQKENITVALWYLWALQTDKQKHFVPACCSVCLFYFVLTTELSATLAK